MMILQYSANFHICHSSNWLFVNERLMLTNKTFTTNEYSHTLLHSNSKARFYVEIRTFVIIIQKMCMLLFCQQDEQTHIEYVIVSVQCIRFYSSGQQSTVRSWISIKIAQVFHFNYGIHTEMKEGRKCNNSL